MAHKLLAGNYQENGNLGKKETESNITELWIAIDKYTKFCNHHQFLFAKCICKFQSRFLIIVAQWVIFFFGTEQ